MNVARRRIRASCDRIASIATIALVIAFYTWTVNAAGGLTKATGNAYKYDYYNHLVHGLLKGHLYLDVEAPAALKALPDPYDPAANRDVGLVDTSYYHEHYYLYFGAAPAVTLMLPYRWITGTDLPTGWAVLIFTSLGFLAASWLWLDLRRRYFPMAGLWTAPLGLLLLGMGCLVGAVLRRPLFWELAVAGGFAFGMLALASVHRAIHAHRRPAAWLVAAGIFLGFAVASRPTYVFAAPILLVPVWFWLRRPPPAESETSQAGSPDAAESPSRPGREVPAYTGSRLRLLAAAVVPFGMLMLAVLAYNAARFDSPFEFGHNYQLSVAYESKVRQFSPENFWFNARLYYFLPGQWSWHPPFVAPTPTPVRPPGFYTVDEVYGLLPIAPLACLAIFVPFALTGRSSIDRRRLGAVMAAGAIQWLAIGGLLLFFVAAVARYAVDFVPPLLVLAGVGLLVVEQRTRTGWLRWPTRGAIALAGIVTFLSTALANFELGHTLPRLHPQFMGAVTKACGQAEAVYDRMVGRHFGPITVRTSFDRLESPRIEPLFEMGDPPARDAVWIEYLPAQRVRFGVKHGELPVRWSASRVVKGAKPHDVRIDLGAFYPGLEHPFFVHTSDARASELTHRIAISVDGESLIRTVGPFYSHVKGSPGRTANGLPADIVALPTDPRAAGTPTTPPWLVLRLPPFATPPAARLPLVASGRKGAGDVLFLELIDAAHARLGYDHWAAPLVFSPPFAWSPGQTHAITLRQDENEWAPLVDGTRLLLAWVDGHPVWRATVPAFGCTPDEVAFGRNPNGHSTCAAEFPGLTHDLTQSPARSAGGTLLLRLVMPPGEKGSWQPLLTIGGAGASDALSFAFVDVNTIQLRFEHRGSALLLGPVIDLGRSPGHDVEIDLPSFAVGSFGRAAHGEILVRWDGVVALRGTTAAFDFTPDQIVFGERPSDSAMTDPRFGGVLVSREWTPREDGAKDR